MLLESQMEKHPSSRNTFLAAKAENWISVKGDEVIISEAGNTSVQKADPWKLLKDFKSRNEWIFGYMGYDLKNSVENLNSENEPLVEAPDMYFFSPQLLLKIDQDEEISILKGEPPDVFEGVAESGEFRLSAKNYLSKEEYLQKVKKVQHDIFEGEYYELNLTHALEFEFSGDSLRLFEQMKKVSPVPFAAYLHTPEVDVCCASPERFLAKKGNRVWSQPIKGTANRLAENEEGIRDLRNSEKERAENLMIVDLVRNDLNRIAIPDSVHVKDLFEIQSFETVHQMVSTVECEVENGVQAVDIIKACFPMGSMTGAPKIAAMKAIERYENYKRGIYSGAIGYIDPDGNFDLNVVIRTAIIQNGKLIFPVGGAITGDSVPEKEWEETWIKAKTITSLLTE